MCSAKSANIFLASAYRDPENIWIFSHHGKKDNTNGDNIRAPPERERARLLLSYPPMLR
jgi:hypothetical protein